MENWRVFQKGVGEEYGLSSGWDVVVVGDDNQNKVSESQKGRILETTRI